MSNPENDAFWESLMDKHWEEYRIECEKMGLRASYSDFMVWAEDKDLVPEFIND